MNDPYLWLEDVTGDAALDWVRERNSDSIGRYASDAAGFTDLQQQIRAILDTDARIPIVTPRGEYIYNYWKDGEHPRGLWRRTTMDSYCTEEPSWDVLIDLDALAAAEGENWVWASAQVLRPDQDRALILTVPRRRGCCGSPGVLHPHAGIHPGSGWRFPPPCGIATTVTMSLSIGSDWRVHSPTI